MIGHGIVIPRPALPPSDCGGPAFCAVCNAEMIKVEASALTLAASHERNLLTGDFDENDMASVWFRRGYNRKYFRDSAIRLLLMAEEDEGNPRWLRVDGSLSPRFALAEKRRAEAEALGLKRDAYDKRRRSMAAKSAGFTQNEFNNLSSTRRKAIIASANIELIGS